MQLNHVIDNLKGLLHTITVDLEKAHKGNKAASQRVRTGTVKLEKLAKHYRKSSILNEKSTKGVKKPKKAGAKPAAKKAAHSKAAHGKAHAKPAHSKTAHAKAGHKPAKKVVKAAPKHKAVSHPRALSFHRSR